VDPLTKGHLAVRIRPPDLECVRVRESGRIVVGRGQPDQHGLAARDDRAADLHVLLGEARQRRLQGTPVAQHLLDGCRRQAGIGLEAGQLLRVGQQREDAAGDQVDRRDVAGEEEDEDHRQELVLVEPVAVLLGVDELADQVVGGLTALLGERAPQVVGESTQVEARFLHLLAVPPGAAAQERLRPAADVVLVLTGDAEHLADDPDRQRVGEGVDQLHRPVRRRLAPLGRGPLGIGEQLVGEDLDARPERVHGAPGEAGLDQLAEPGVVGRVDAEQVPPERPELLRHLGHLGKLLRRHGDLGSTEKRSSSRAAFASW
jgi:hypothetical protein